MVYSYLFGVFHLMKLLFLGVEKFNVNYYFHEKKLVNRKWLRSSIAFSQAFTVN